jgi:hypothetical protein
MLLSASVPRVQTTMSADEKERIEPRIIGTSGTTTRRPDPHQAEAVTRQS